MRNIWICLCVRVLSFLITPGSIWLCLFSNIRKYGLNVMAWFAGLSTDESVKAAEISREEQYIRTILSHELGVDIVCTNVPQKFV